MNNDLISREALKKDIDFQYICKCCHNVNGNVCDICSITEIEKKIDNAPTVEERPQGKWLKNANEIYRCSLCGAYGNPKYFRFCPNCGAEMQKGGAE